MSNESEFWYPVPSQQTEDTQGRGTDPAPKLPPKVPLPYDASSEESDASGDEKDAGLSDQNEINGLLYGRIEREERERYLAQEVAFCREFDDAVSTVFAGAEATAAARQAYARFDPRDPDPQAFEFRNFVSSEYEKFGYF